MIGKRQFTRRSKAYRLDILTNLRLCGVHIVLLLLHIRNFSNVFQPWFLNFVFLYKMSSLNRNSSAEFPVDLKHVLHVWKVLNGSRFSSSKFTLHTIKGRRQAVAALMARSYDRIRILTTNWTLDGPEQVAESHEPLIESTEDAILSPVVSTDTSFNSLGRKSLITSEEYEDIRDVIHTMYENKAYVTLKTLLEPVQEKLKRKVGKSTLYRVLRRMGFKYQ